MTDSFEKPGFDGRVYSNPRSFVNWVAPTLRAVIRWRLWETDHSKIPSNTVLEQSLPVLKPEFDLKSKISATWLGHATVFVSLDGINFITDPVFARRASPFSCFGPIRYRPVPCQIEDLPNLNFAVISHNHYDHCDKNAIRRLSARFPDLEWFVPKGLGQFMRNNVNNSVHEMSWGEHLTISTQNSKYQIYCIPAQHWSQRGLTDRNKTLWSGWAVIGPTRKFYYTGDTGFCEDEFRKLGVQLGPFDLSAIPIGCYAPRWFMKPQHINPEEAIKIHKMSNSRKSLAIHWGTYSMGSYEPYLEPRSLLREEVEKAGLAATDFFTLEHGGTWSEDPNEETEFGESIMKKKQK
ncbi:N-acetylphosphatidylethanolamine-hydrolyzing phospholipase D [Aphelenchoides besseyi]|nr:N-acetylphosphatidylethanolamine-hydrolyzing phospholipase D [Aphelenchoides besseyi]KAI6211961.1 N-acetylphosphatidylethanolamine-hydrolyzing phospholipase D [Aphelenchoides besseyi]